MSLAENPWDLPSARAFLTEAAELLADGGGVIVGGTSMPGALPKALETYLRARLGGHFIRVLVPEPATPPAQTVATLFGSNASDVEGLVRDDSLMDHVLLVDLPNSGANAAPWTVFLRRFLVSRQSAGSYFSILLISPSPLENAEGLPVLAWGGRLQRIDVSIWADLHVPLGRIEPLASLAEALSVELGAWRLDLAGAIAGAPTEDLLQPMKFLESWGGAAIHEADFLSGVEIECSTALLERGAQLELNHRIWRAQLRAFFPWIEELRQWVIERHRKLLVVDQEQQRLGVRTLEDIEFGGIARQLRSKVAPVEADLLGALARLRNDLAHHKPVESGDMWLVLQSLKGLRFRRACESAKPVVHSHRVADRSAMSASMSRGQPSSENSSQYGRPCKGNLDQCLTCSLQS